MCVFASGLRLAEVHAMDGQKHQPGQERTRPWLAAHCADVEMANIHILHLIRTNMFAVAECSGS